MNRRTIVFLLSFLIISSASLWGQANQYLNLRYADGYGVDHLLDLEVPESSEPLPLVVFIHGGGWSGGDKSNFRSRMLVDYGYAAASLNYRLTGTDIWPAQIHDCKAAIRWLRANAETYNIDPDRIGVWGSSAGGHLVSMLGTTNGLGEVTIDTLTIDLKGNVGNFLNVSSEVQAVCDWYGPSNLLSIVDQFSQINRDSINCPEAKLIGGILKNNPARAKSASPVYFVDPTDPPFLIMHGTADPTVPYEQSVEFDSVLNISGIDVTFLPLQNAGHGGILFNTDAVAQTVTAFFNLHLKGKSDPPEDHLVGHWTFNESAGDTVYDRSVNEIHGISQGTVRVDGMNDRALNFNGNDLVLIPGGNMAPPEEISGLQYGTISVWFKYREFYSEMIPILYFGESQTGTAQSSLIVEIGHGWQGNRKLYFTIINTRFCFDSGCNIPVDTWTHFAATVSPAGNTGFLNGVEMTQRNYNLGSNKTYTDFFASVPEKKILAIGYGRYGKADPFMHFRGVIDDVRIYDRALNSLEIQQLYEEEQITVISESKSLPDDILLFQNYPNPFNPETTIQFQNAQAGYVSLKMYDLTGREVAVLIEKYLGTGLHTIKFNGKNFTSGVYFYTIQDDNFVQTRKCVLLK